MEDFPAHIRIDKSGISVQTVAQHCFNTAEYAMENTAKIGFGNMAYLAGIYHDIGKYTEKFHQYIDKASRNESVKKGSVNHSFAGVRYVLEKYHNDKISCEKDYLAELIAYVIGSHHGLFDIVDKDSKNGFVYRLQKEDIDYEEAKENYLKILSSDNDFEDKWMASVDEIKKFFNNIVTLTKSGKEFTFYWSMLTRLILSAVIDGDRRDTAEFLTNTVVKNDITNSFWSDNIKYFNYKLNMLSANNESQMTKCRQKISDLCYEASFKESGIYRLNVPTGGGKTLSSLRFALNHAEKWRKSRIIYVMPLLSIIEQNASVIKSFIKDDRCVLEHHSNVLDEEAFDDYSYEKEKRKLCIESWNSPIIITTLVQFLYTLFKSKTSSIRRMHALSNSIIIIDEVQSIPVKMLSLFNLACNFLTKVCGVTLLLCSATQPCFENVEHGMHKGIQNLIEIPQDILDIFKRTQLVDKGRMSHESFIDFVDELIINVNSLLIICNTKNEAKKVFESLRERNMDTLLTHLSAGMCIEHREKTIDLLRSNLAEKKGKIICVSTQVIEAGVDVSFESVIRFQAGMDSIIQAAGRCNRHAELRDVANVYIVDYQDENIDKMKEMLWAKLATQELLYYKENYSDLTSDNAIAAYYRFFYKNIVSDYQNFTVNEGESIFKMLSDNSIFSQHDKSQGKYFMNQAFKEAGDKFDVFKSDTVDVIVPYGNGNEIITELLSEEAKYSIGYIKDIIKKAGRCSVAVFRYQLEELRNKKAITMIQSQGVYFLAQEFYDDDMGIISEPTAQVGYFF